MKQNKISPKSHFLYFIILVFLLILIEEASATSVVPPITSYDQIIYSDYAGTQEYFTITFSNQMDMTVLPKITFSPVVSATLANCMGSWDTYNDGLNYDYVCDILPSNQIVSGVDVTVSGAKDSSGKIVSTYTEPALFGIDMGSASGPVLTTINILPSSMTLNAGSTQQFTATTLDQYGNPISASITWTSSDASIGTITSSGFFTSIAAGTTTITATDGIIIGTSSITVNLVCIDNDLDGYNQSAPGCGLADCDDNTNFVNPGTAEICNEIDDNCNEQVDENLLTKFFQDHDGDSFGNPLVFENFCIKPLGYVIDNSDCDDNKDYVNLNAAEKCTDGIDNNCNGLTDLQETLCEVAPVPIVSFISPLNQTYNTSEIIINIASINASSIWWGNGTANHTYISPVTLNLSDGQYHFIVYANNSVNTTSSYVSFSVNTSWLKNDTTKDNNSQGNQSSNRISRSSSSKSSNSEKNSIQIGFGNNTMAPNSLGNSISQQPAILESNQNIISRNVDTIANLAYSPILLIIVLVLIALVLVFVIIRR